MAEENVAKTITAAPVEELPGSERPDYRGRCLYKTGKCMQERALKTSGAAHNLCDEHRSRQNEHQRKLDAKNRITKKERRSSAGSAASGTLSAETDEDTMVTVMLRTRSPRYAPYPAPAAATATATATAKRRSLPLRTVASAFTGAKGEAEAVASSEMPISSASAPVSAAVSAASIAHLAPSVSVTRSGLQGLATSTAATSVVAAGSGSSGGMLYLPNGPQPPQLSYPCVMQDFDGIVVPLPSYLEGLERIEFRSRIYQKVMDFISEECILRFGTKVETDASVASRPVATAVPAAVGANMNAQSTVDSQPQAAGSDRLESKSASSVNASGDTRATQSSKKPRAAAGSTTTS